MSQIMKAFTGIYMLLLMMVVSAAILGMFLRVLHAQNLHAALIDEMENSNYAVSVLKESFTVAKEAGYQVELTVFRDGKDPLVLKKNSDVPAGLTDVLMAEVTLSYPFTIPFLGIDEQQQIYGYAR